MNARPSTADSLRLRRELRTEIARHRRRINAGVVQLEREGRKVISWRTHAARHPFVALGSAFGVGLALSAGLPRSGWWRWLAMLVFRNLFSGLPSMFLHEALAAVMNVAQSARKR